MTYSYNRLWKLLIDKRMKKTEMHKAAHKTAGNSNLHMSQADKVDAFYTQISLIENELKEV